MTMTPMTSMTPLVAATLTRGGLFVRRRRRYEYFTGDARAAAESPADTAAIQHRRHPRPVKLVASRRRRRKINAPEGPRQTDGRTGTNLVTTAGTAAVLSALQVVRPPTSHISAADDEKKTTPALIYARRRCRSVPHATSRADRNITPAGSKSGV